ncbi:hypothetical protein K450DRAFT_258301 [Umbelopsis ramanniana AG]|uniref:Uncharacterized protein n=1 Tax=Umbelopsis ramanniana AG TaxID=1314678 RepID=A0AAD5E2X2_UMBRA|nr:uncharacterized protein K450DRAFT_258301 [Umbelopsis ramanniana AG]KAI8576158.1 hypothetical protein K450DRAFT_258301 [Umbelopsis ramanniana AG]
MRSQQINHRYSFPPLPTMNTVQSKPLLPEQNRSSTESPDDQLVELCTKYIPSSLFIPKDKLEPFESPLTESNLKFHTTINPPSKESKAALVYRYVQLQKHMVKLEDRLRRDIESKKIKLVPLDLQGQESEVIRDDHIEGCLSVGSNISALDLHRPCHEQFLSPSESAFPRTLVDQPVKELPQDAGKKRKSLKRKLISLLRKSPRKSRVAGHSSNEPSFEEANHQSLRETVSMSTLNHQRLSIEERLRKHRSMPIGTTFALYQEEKLRLIQQNARLSSTPVSSSPPSPTQKSTGSHSNRKRDSNVSLLASISLRSLFKMENNQSHQKRFSKSVGVEILDYTEELSDTVHQSNDASLGRQDSFLAFRYPKMAPLDYLEQANIKYDLTSRAQEIQMLENSVKRFESVKPSSFQNLAALAVSF